MQVQHSDRSEVKIEANGWDSLKADFHRDLEAYLGVNINLTPFSLKDLGVDKDRNEFFSFSLYTFCFYTSVDCCTRKRKIVEKLFEEVEPKSRKAKKIPPHTGMVYRAFEGNLSHFYQSKKDEIFVWSCFSSTVQLDKVQDLLRNKGPITLFNIETKTARKISEKAVIILPYSRFKIYSTFVHGDLTIVHLKEVEPNELFRQIFPCIYARDIMNSTATQAQSAGMDKPPRGNNNDDVGFMLWNAIHKYVSKVVDTLYPNKQSFECDPVLLEWIAGCTNNEKADIRGFRVTDAQSLKYTLTNVIFISNVGHTNFHQYYYGSRVLNRPTHTTQEMPQSPEDIDMEWIYNALPVPEKMLFRHLFSVLLSTTSDQPLSTCLKTGNQIIDDARELFQEDLNEISKVM